MMSNLAESSNGRTPDSASGDVCSTHTSATINLRERRIPQTTDVLASIVADIGTFLTAAVGWMGEVADFVVGEPFILLMCCVIPLSGWAIAGLKRLISLA